MNDQTMIKRGRNVWLIILIAVQLLFLGGIACFHYSALWVGKEITLRTVPVDPRDQLYGDYVQLNYAINNASWTDWKETGDKAKHGDTVYVLLALDNVTSTYEIKGVYDNKPDRGTGEVVLKGRVQYTTDDTLRITYGLEQYYVEENTGKELEQRAGKLIVEVKVAPWGSAIIERIQP
ncbi:GDYXXLXY domain-containing protein [Paenibacillus lignilyticus]|uniref:GDYXXLXY domain-containing protein n=1 Tax=Paenibacillus lignilyticus TaxID=1172615 RepID=A0ABS5CAP4_9BACL|nr:GDYXXLXY domain-containing protein [Paenibacillus lignilyticus]MBP3962173.1 GDYXXLXY domain-containing protein [Paenibacillus lignilyticus]